MLPLCGRCENVEMKQPEASRQQKQAKGKAVSQPCQHPTSTFSHGPAAGGHISTLKKRPEGRFFIIVPVLLIHRHLPVCFRRRDLSSAGVQLLPAYYRNGS